MPKFFLIFAFGILVFQNSAALANADTDAAQSENDQAVASLSRVALVCENQKIEARVETLKKRFN